MVHRDFPLPMHAYSRVAANYSRAAAHIGKNDVVEEALFQNQEKWEANGDVKGSRCRGVDPGGNEKGAGPCRYKGAGCADRKG